MAAVAFLSLIGRCRSTCLALLAGTAVQNSSLAKKYASADGPVTATGQSQSASNRSGVDDVQPDLRRAPCCGPGHGKVVIVTYLATHPAQLKNSLKLTFAASILQGSVAIMLVTVLLGVLQLSSRYLHQSSFWLEKGSFLLVIALGILLCFRAIKRLYRQVKLLKPQKISIQRIQPLSADHIHSESCGCGHRHMPSSQELHAGNDWRTRLAIILAMGMRPCSGAIMVLLFAKVIGVYRWGILSAIAMAIGTSLTISLLALFVHYARRMAVHLSRKRAPAAWGAIAWATLALTGGIILLFAGALLYLSSQPDFIGGVRPFGR